MDLSQTGAAEPGRTSERCTRLTQDLRSIQIIQAAIRLFAQKGFRGTKTREIAEAAGINEALIFRDFQTKERLYCAILEYASTRINAFEWIEELSPYTEQRKDEMVFTTLALRLFEAFDRERDLFRLMLYSALEHHQFANRFRERQIEPLEQFIEAYVHTRQREHAFRNGEPLALTRSFLSMCHHHILRHVLFDDREWPADAATAATFASVFLDGVRAQ